MATGKIDWRNHIVAFVATMIGIFVGLGLDEWQQDNEAQERLTEFVNLIDQEIINNIEGLDDFLNTSSQGESLVSFMVDRDFDNGILKGKMQEIDSIMKVHPFIKVLIFEYSEIQSGKIKADIGYGSGNYSFQNTVWESFKSTDLINKLSIKDIARYTKIYQRLNSVKDQGQFNESSNLIMDYTSTDQVDLKELLKLYIRINRLVDQNLFFLKPEIGKEHKSKYVVFRQVNP